MRKEEVKAAVVLQISSFNYAAGCVSRDPDRAPRLLFAARLPPDLRIIVIATGARTLPVMLELPARN